MITIRNLTLNISRGQGSVSPRFIIAGLDAIYEKLKNRITIEQAELKLDGTMIHLRVPSEKSKTVMYDVVIWFKSKDKIGMDTELKIFSNSSNFAYNFVYVFYQDGSLLFPEKYPRDFLTIPPRVRNPYGLYGFDKHVYSALKHVFRFDIGDLILKKSKNGQEFLVTDFENKKFERENA